MNAMGEIAPVRFESSGGAICSRAIEPDAAFCKLDGDDPTCADALRARPADDRTTTVLMETTHLKTRAIENTSYP